ncbi:MULTISPECIES: sugar phosphatase [Enterobacteriaceae]|uniref:sugar phosphatase n=1 Tax=Enterobacteriaceae TaxID=543 RepID=UPI0015DD3529|nr:MULTISPECIES: sugar phosphatase [unclassified Klebsiella]HAT3952398.1 sugar phosphatase [Kluyvera ascorbata]BBR59771.1 sugar phosphatase [Klebsiella sp. WP4-W18-ESBL-05]BBS90893.1 sugar phosphatase [Klebsiella sp. WP7-S18-CRE-02]BBS95916.1 sugar phosphatase [Klebsiella sp. WP7-S18-CRE-03]BBT00946.1 sugar phosphatase [Klebsiella sp. WP7-S18-ESBL-04]
MQCKGFLFDLDGTLVDSLAVVERSWRFWAESYGVSPDAVLDFIHGKQAITTLRHFMPGKSEAEIQAEFLRLEQIEATDLDGISALPGALALLNQLDAQHIPWAIVTSGSIPVAHARHRAAGLPMPAVFVTAEQVKRGKPQPDAYLLGAERLGLAPQSCLVVEDAPAGVQSGLAAGCRVAAVNVPAGTPELRQVDFVLSTLASLRVEKLPSGLVNVSQNA